MREPLIPGGYVILPRKIIESEIWNKPPLYLKVWVYLLTRAQHKEFKRLKRGQLFVSIPEIQEACSWYVGFRKETPSKEQVYRVIDWLRKPHEQVDEEDTKTTMITTTKATHGLLITIDNYEVYQNPKNYESNSERHHEDETNATRTKREHDNINKNDKECIKNEKNDNKKTNVDEMEQTPKNISSIDEINSFVDSRINELPSGVSRRVLVNYFDCIRMTRSTCRISENVLINLLDKMKKFSADQINYALWLHFEQHDDKKENYTLGILRNTKEPEARRGLIKLKNKNGGVDIAVGQSSNEPEYEYPF